ncbi:regulator of G-protein signaling 3-like isoform X4 [Girardinichthys multiradiatus]|uniref:regulator of G-protein signaling 3-like isoform X4 n=1 Tax=Girardinichthys multiradiatus TaxID=208333 RepID=UPI001FAE1BF8|nr:regulator of G-protein signaling 3-like isoform X4 [Girardinichthys multiradiatus]
MLLWDSPLMDTSSRCSRESSEPHLGSKDVLICKVSNHRTCCCPQRTGWRTLQNQRACRGAGPQLHQEARVLDSKRRSKEEEEERLITGRRKENTDPGEGLHQTRKIQNLYKDYRWFLQNSTRTRYAAGSGFRSGHELQSCRPEIRLALIRKTRIQNSVQIKDKNNVIDFVPKDQTDAGSTETNVDQNKETRTSSKFSETRTSRSSDRRAGWLQETISRSETRPRTRRRKIHQSAFRGRGQLRLSITLEAGQLIIHIHEARGLMGKSCGSCDSYVKLSVTSDLHDSIGIKTQTFRNNKNPAYQRNFSLCVSEPLHLSRLLVSVLRRLPKPRCSQLIGCMSFGIGSLSHSSQLITGWFYLLGEEFGHSKHMRVTSQSYRPIKSLQVTVERQEVESTADLRRTPDSAPDPDLIHTSTLTRTKQSVSTITTSSRPNVSTQHSMGSGGLGSLDSDDANYSSYVTSQHLAINIIRGKDGFGFTICSDCPVRVQAVDPGGPAHQSGLCQGDSVLQLNGLPVETWKCADLAQAIRSCPSQVVLVVWRGLPELSSAGETLLRPQVHNALTTTKLLSHPAHSKYSRRWSQGRGLRSGRGFLGSLWRDRKEDQDQEETKDKQMFSTIKSTRATASNGDNYIILSPVNSEGQLPQQIYHDRNGTIGRLYQTHPSRGQNLLHNTRAGMSQQSITSHTSTLPVSQPRTMALDPPGNPGNYQNCTIVQSHLPQSGYGNYTSLPPKTLIFPIFVQPLDLCSSDRTLRMSEEMILHQTDLLPSKVTVLIYSDLMLITRKDEAGRCNVLQSPLYLNMLQLREVLRRSLSEGSLVKEPRSPRFLSDSTIHRLTRTSTFDLTLTLGTSPCPPSPQTLRKQLTKEGASLHQMLMLLNGSKGGTSSNCKLKKKKTKSLAADIQSRLAFLRRRKNYAGIHGNSLEKALKNNRPSEGEVKRWAESLEALLTHQYGVAVFRHFLRSEFSEENLDFWLAVEEFKRTLSFSKMADHAKKIYDEFISTSAARQVNVDSFVRDSTNQSLIFNVNTTSFQLAQDQIFSLMEADSYPRFLKSCLYAQLANYSTATALELSNQSRSVS